jgi:hypothetical protein
MCKVVDHALRPRCQLSPTRSQAKNGLNHKQQERDRDPDPEEIYQLAELQQGPEHQDGPGVSSLFKTFAEVP